MTHARLRLSVFALTATLATACLPAEDPVGGSSVAATSLDGSTSSETSTSTTADSSTSSTGASTGEAEDTDCDFVCSEPDNTPSECDTMRQDCPEGLKCNPADIDGDGSFDAALCVPVIDEPGARGDHCQRLHGDGHDTCGHGLMCWDPDPNGVGMCMELCRLEEDEDPELNGPSCSEDWLHCIGKDAFLCLPECDPLIGDCPVGCGCYPVETGLFCVIDASGGEGVVGAPCEFINVCNPGSYCSDATAFADCGELGCCTPFCDLSAPECPEQHTCVPFFEEAAAPPHLVNVGSCLAEAP